MNQTLTKIAVVALAVLGIPIALAQPQEGEVSHWEDGSPMGCKYLFDQEPFYEWDQYQPPPVDVQSAAAAARHSGEQKNLQNVAVLSFRLIGVRPHAHDYPMLVWFVKYIGFPSRALLVRSNEHHWLAVTSTGKIVEPVCE